jgi:hypothetical protein
VRARNRSVEELGNINPGMQTRRLALVWTLNCGDDAGGFVDVGLGGLGLGPPGSIGCAYDAVTGLCNRGVVLETQRHTENVWCVGLKDDCLAFAIKFKSVIGILSEKRYKV